MMPCPLHTCQFHHYYSAVIIIIIIIITDINNTSK